MTFLLDVNVLIALVDPDHVHHVQTHTWFARKGQQSFATCPITENGLLRIVGNPKYPNSPGPPSAIAKSLLTLKKQKGHHFWPDSISIVEQGTSADLSSHSRVTDEYLFMLAQVNGGRLATLDHRMASTRSNRRDVLELI
jgi:uncharacterized protein